MKLTLIADVHGNLPALEAVLRHARVCGAAQTILNLGDLTGYGPYPEEVVRWSRSPQVISILGDYDKKVLSDKQRKESWQRVKKEDKRAMFAWTYQALSKSSRKFLRSLPELQYIEVEGVRILLSHGSPIIPSDHGQRNAPPAYLVELAATEGASVVVSGHTHQAFSYEERGVHFFNPGTVGRSDDGDPRASYAILEIENGEVRVEHFRVPYDIMAAVYGLRRAGLPEVFTQVVRRGLNYDDTISVFGDPSPLEPSGTVTLLTDFGLKDHFVGVMKGVIKGIAPQASLIDISHQVRPQSVVEGARMLSQAVPYFPAGTVHVAVVDPGVGTERRALAAQIGGDFFVAPDNGLLTLLLEKAQVEGLPVKLISLTKPDYWLPDISAIFHGRDVFAPVGAHLANGIPLSCLGEEIDDPFVVTLPQPQPTATGWQAEVVLLDGFGNVCTNLLGSRLTGDKDNTTVRIGEITLNGLTHTFGDASPGELIALIDSTGHLAIAKVNGNAADALDVHIGTPVFVEIKN
jgi:S-adenosyl-L-methionine hydrolase (adenosine-forming)